MKKAAVIAAAAVVFSLCRIAFCEEIPTIDLTGYQAAPAVETEKPETVVVKLSGKINRAYNPDYHAVVPGARVWIAEYPFTRDLDIRSDETGWWAMRVKKFRGAPLEASFVYEKKGWATTKSNAIPVRDEDDTDIAIQYIDPTFFFGAAKPMIEKMLSETLPPGADPTLKNALVATVGKSWASIHDDRLPHGDPGATAAEIPGAVGPIYFDESVWPNLSYKATSVDGGVAWLNVPPGAHVVTAAREGVEYDKIKFVVDAADAEKGIILYIASPPDSIQGSNASGPGESEIVPAGAAEEKGETTGAGETNARPTPREAIELQFRLIAEGDVEELKENFTPRLRDMITEDAVLAAREEVDDYTIDDLVAEEKPFEDAGLEKVKIMMANGRTLTTLIWNGEKWLADTIWFR